MPAEFDKCVRALVADPDFKPQNKKQNKRDAAYAVCVSQYKKRHEGKSPFADANMENMSLSELMEKDHDLALTVLFLKHDRQFWSKHGNT
jgi:oxalate decarboxylase/phosphoglucose isomerase-like protein (cupin superfamily)